MEIQFTQTVSFSKGFFQFFPFFIIFLSLGVWDPKFMNPKVGDRPGLLPVLTPVLSNSRWSLRVLRG